MRRLGAWNVGCALVSDVRVSAVNQRRHVGMHEWPATSRRRTDVRARVPRRRTGTSRAHRGRRRDRRIDRPIARGRTKYGHRLCGLRAGRIGVRDHSDRSRSTHRGAARRRGSTSTSARAGTDRRTVVDVRCCRSVPAVRTTGGGPLARRTTGRPDSVPRAGRAATRAAVSVLRSFQTGCYAEGRGRRVHVCHLRPQLRVAIRRAMATGCR